MLPDRCRNVSLVIAGALIVAASHVARAESGAVVDLPPPRTDGPLSVESALAERRSVRKFTDAPLSLAHVSQLLWAAQGVTERSRGGRTAPSAGALYPLELYLVAGAVTGLEPGIYRYDPKRHRLETRATGDRRAELARTALEQNWVAEAPAVLIIGAIYERTARKYESRAPRYVHMEVGHAAQNVYLQVEALDLGTVMVGAFRDAPLQRALDLPSEVEPLAVMPVGMLRR